ncbi:MAG: DinB family protein [Vicinamibacterales bacterium]
MVRSTTVAMALACVSFPSVALAQVDKGIDTNPVSAAIRQSWAEAKRNMQESGALMPEANYGYKPIDAVRSFGAILAHVAGASYEFCAAAKGQKPPHAEDEFEKSAVTKAAITKALTDAIAYCDAAYTALTDKTAAEVVTGAFGAGKAARASALLGNTSHFNEHYGNLVTYFRIKGMVPPSSQPRK